MEVPAFSFQSRWRRCFDRFILSPVLRSPRPKGAGSEVEGLAEGLSRSLLRRSLFRALSELGEGLVEGLKMVRGCGAIGKQ